MLHLFSLWISLINGILVSRLTTKFVSSVTQFHSCCKASKESFVYLSLISFHFWLYLCLTDHHLQSHVFYHKKSKIQSKIIVTKTDTNLSLVGFHLQWKTLSFSSSSSFLISINDTSVFTSQSLLRQGLPSLSIVFWSVVWKNKYLTWSFISFSSFMSSLNPLASSPVSPSVYLWFFFSLLFNFWLPDQESYCVIYMFILASHLDRLESYESCKSWFYWYCFFPAFIVPSWDSHFVIKSTSRRRRDLLTWFTCFCRGWQTTFR